MIAVAFLYLVADVSAASTPANGGDLVTREGDNTSLQAFLKSAEKMNLDKRISTETVNRAQAEYEQAWMGLLPAIIVNGSYTNNQYTAELPVIPGLTTAPAIIQAKNQWQGTAQALLPVIDAGRWLRASAASASSDANQERDRLSVDNTRRITVSAYYAYAAALALLQSSLKTVGVAEEQQRLTEIRRNVGSAIELDVLRARAEVQRNVQLVADSRSVVATSGRSLRTISGIQPDTDIRLPTDDLRAEAGFEELEKGIDKLPSVRSSEKDELAAYRNKIASRLALVPVLSAQFTETLTNVTGFTGHGLYYTAGALLTWRLDGPTIETMRVQNALAATAQLNVEKARLAAQDQIHSDWQRLNAALVKVTAAESQVVASQKASQVARDKYAVGSATQLELIQAERDVFSAEVSQIQAKTDLAIARSSLRISAGLPLFR